MQFCGICLIWIAQNTSLCKRKTSLQNFPSDLLSVLQFCTHKRGERGRVACGQKSHVLSAGSSLRNVCFACEPCRSLDVFACLVESSLICLQFLLPPARTHLCRPIVTSVRSCSHLTHICLLTQVSCRRLGVRQGFFFFFFLRAAVINVSLTREALCVEDPLTHCRANTEPQPFSAD